ncbi:MAG: 4-(cytidine 5'-diphospho)-2-C-methyl-D-erythritol kinase [Alphaproteobacteria bacterium]|nr:4-(cytidine 5'-diphospho)-2-C-methyl-D-erythritol kinase [Alphaproteobacteria bacterium]
MSGISFQAPAKVNLYLHVTGRRADGYHLLDSLFVFAKDGDVITVWDAEDLSLEITGPYARFLPDGQDNIVLKAARSLAKACDIRPQAKILLEKNLPVASGIGGGSADAAAALKALIQLWNLKIPSDKLHQIALDLGADVPSCLASEAVQVAGIGDILTPAPALPKLFVLLVNPNKPVSTPLVFKTRSPVFSKAEPFTRPITDFNQFINALSERHNDLCDAACQIEPAVAQVLRTLEEYPSCRLARMSGSGGTCFGLFPSAAEANTVCDAMRRSHPDWWFLNTIIE